MSRPSPWNGVLEALHSALIDTLIEEFPDRKPELGMPVRSNAWSLQSDVTHLVVREMVCDQSHALGGIAVNDAAQAAIVRTKSSVELFFEKLMRRAEPDLKRRGLLITSSSERVHTPTRVIWIPLRIHMKNESLVFHLGIGI